MESFEVKVFYTVNGVSKTDRFVGKEIHACVRATKRKNKGCIVTGTCSRELSAIDKSIPTPPQGWQHARFRCKTKKNRWGREINIPEEMNYEVLNGESQD
jgi:hypothetical protein